MSRKQMLKDSNGKQYILDETGSIHPVIDEGETEELIVRQDEKGNLYLVKNRQIIPLHSTRKTKPQSPNRGCWQGFFGAIAAAFIGLVASFIVQTPNAVGVNQPVIIVFLQTITGNQPESPPTSIVLLTPTPFVVTATPEIPTQTPQIVTLEPPTETPFFPTSTPTIEPSPTVRSPISLGRFSVLSNTNQGTQYEIEQTGLYIFHYVGGSYSTYPENEQPAGIDTWLTVIRVYQGEFPIWKNNNPEALSDQTFFRIAETRSYWPSAETAQTRAQTAQDVRVNLNQGDILTFVAVDEQSWYFDNPGEVTIEIMFVPE